MTSRPSKYPAFLLLNDFMFLKAALIGVFTLITAIQVSGQNNPGGWFRAPLDTPLIMTGTFGEIRNGHFHTGVDFSTGEQEGVSVKAVADGYVSRIKVSPTGFGRVLYITHPNGYVSVYAHLKSFREDLRQYTLTEQQARKSYDIELLPAKDRFKVVKGEEIALSGNTGNTDGPHLHFEMREEETEQPINPLLFGLPVNDHVKPILRGLRVYPHLQAGIVEQTDSARTFEIFPSDTLYGVATPGPDYIKVYGRISVGFDVYDLQDSGTAELGVYSGTLYVDGTKVYEWVNDRLDFDESRYANAHGDYTVRKRDGVRVERCYRMAGNYATKIYPDTLLTGIMEFIDEESHDLHFVATDFAGNRTEIFFQLQSYPPLANKPYQAFGEEAVLISPSKGIAIHKDNLDVVVPGGAVYEECWYTDDQFRNEKALSPTFLIGDRYEALHIPIGISLKPYSKVPDTLRSRALIVRAMPDGTLQPEGGIWNKEFLTAKVREFGRYYVLLDTVAPSVTKEYYPADMNTYRGGIAQWIVKDDLSGLKSWTATIDGQWVLAEYDAKSGMVTVDLAGLPLNNEHKVELTVADERGNSQIWKDSFWW
jgi:hypothetical protein